MSNQFIGEIRMFGGNFAIKGWALCDGQILSIAQNQALFSLLGTNFGGDGRSTFALPDLRGRLPIGEGQGFGLTNRTLGEPGGTENVTLSLSQIPTHNHMLIATAADATSPSIGSSLLMAKTTLAPAATGTPAFYTKPGTPPPPMENLDPSSLAVVGGSQPHSNLMPSLCLTFIIALQGIFPSRN